VDIRIASEHRDEAGEVDAHVEQARDRKANVVLPRFERHVALSWSHPEPAGELRPKAPIAWPTDDPYEPHVSRHRFGKGVDFGVGDDGKISGPGREADRSRVGGKHRRKITAEHTQNPVVHRQLLSRLSFSVSDVGVAGQGPSAVAFGSFDPHGRSPRIASWDTSPRRGGDVPGSPIVEAQGLRKVYDTGSVKVDALQGVDLAVEAGEMVAIMGPSGCGKTTLLNCLSGLDAIDGGDVRIEGQSLAAMSDRERTDYRARRMGFVFQFYNLMPVLSAVENVELPLLVARVPVREARRRAIDALALVGLADRAAHQPDELSGGERQRVTIARALVNDPAIVWADEPTGDLDSEMADEIVTLMRRLNQQRGFTFIIVTHDISVGRRTDRIIRMLDGQVVEEQVLEAANVRTGHAA
jgi:putative ABC transport system ATP-binding protein